MVTGGAGAIGSNLVRALSSQNSILVLDNLSSGRKEWIENVPNVELIVGDICNDHDLRKCFSQKIDYVFHLAAHFANQNSVDHPGTDLQTNGMGTLKLLEHAVSAKLERFLYASSSCVYGSLAEKGPHEEVIGDLETPYAITKLLGEYYTTFFHEHYQLPTTIIRIFNCYGPYELSGQYRNVIPKFFDFALKKKPLPILGTGRESRTFTFVDDIIQGMLLAIIDSKANGENYNLGSYNVSTIKELADEINRLTSNPAGVEYHEVRSWDRVKIRKANIEKAILDLGFNPKIGLKEGLREYYTWYKTVQS